MVEPVGPGYVGIGMDSVLKSRPSGGNYFKRREYWPESQYSDAGSGYVPPEAFPQVTQALLDRGDKDSHVRGILGGNFLRVAGQVWR